MQFALTLQPQKPELLNYYQKIKFMRSQNQPTLPTTIEQEKKLNPFLRVDQDDFKEIDHHLSPLEKFTIIRELRSQF